MADKDEIRDRSDIVEVVQTAVALKKRGRNYVGLCPFHQEKTGSFNVDPSTQTFHCFGCGVGGDVFTFVEKYQNMSFVEAAEFLARRAGLAFDRKGVGADPQKTSEREQIYQANSAAASFFREMLGKSQFARDYVAGRGISQETIQKFKLGFAPEGWGSLVNHLRVRGIDLKIAEKAGLIRLNERREYFDMFRNRIMFPIHDDQERVVGFGGRAFGDDQPKYLNTGETPVFAKSKLLYGLPFARRVIATDGRALLMEGYMDVIAAHQAGFQSAIATLGTSLTDEHAKKLARLVPENPTVVLVYDADNAGIKATLRASEILEKEGVLVRVVRLPAGDDPDSILKRGERQVFQNAVDNALSRVEYLIEYAKSRHDLAKADGKLGFLRDLYRILLVVHDGAACDEQIVKYADMHPLAIHGVPSAVEQMRHELQQTRAKSRSKAAPSGSPEQRPKEKKSNVDPTATFAMHDNMRKLLESELGPDLGKRDGSVLSPRKKALLDAYKKLKYGNNPSIVPPAVGTGGQTAEQRAERELIRALAEQEWRAVVLKSTTDDDFLTEIGKRFRKFAATIDAELQASGGDLMAELARHEDQEFSLAVRSQLQEINALMAKVPLNTAAIAGCVHTLRQHRAEAIQHEMAQFLQSKPVLTGEDLQSVREHQRMLRGLKGSGATEGLAKE